MGNSALFYFTCHPLWLIHISTSLEDNINISVDDNISCGLDINSSNRIMISDILDFNITDDTNTNVTTTEDTDTNTNNNNTTTENINSAIGGTPQENALSATRITLRERPDNHIPLQATVKVKIENSNLSSDKLKFTGIIKETGNTKYKKHEFSSASIIGTGIKEFKFKNIPVNLADERRFYFYLKIENIENGQFIEKETQILVRVSGKFYGQEEGSDSESFTKNNIFIKDNNWKEELDEQTSTYTLDVNMAIDKIGKYSFRVDLYWNGLLKYSSSTTHREIDGNNIKKEFNESFTIKDIEKNSIEYHSKFIITNLDMNQSVEITDKPTQKTLINN